MSLLKFLPKDIEKIIYDYKYSIEMIELKNKLHEEFTQKIKKYTIYFKNPSIYLGFLINEKKILLYKLT